MNPVLSSILAIGFWVLAAIAIVVLIAFVYVEVQYYHWNKQDRNHAEMVKEISDRLAEIIDQSNVKDLADDIKENSKDSENNFLQC